MAKHRKRKKVIFRGRVMEKLSKSFTLREIVLAIEWRDGQKMSDKKLEKLRTLVSEDKEMFNTYKKLVRGWRENKKNN